MLGGEHCVWDEAYTNTFYTHRVEKSKKIDIAITEIKFGSHLKSNMFDVNHADDHAFFYLM